MALCAPLRAASRARARNRSRAACRSAPAEARACVVGAVCVRASACVRACAHLRARAYARVHMCVCMRVCMHARVCARANVRAAAPSCPRHAPHLRYKIYALEDFALELLHRAEDVRVVLRGQRTRRMRAASRALPRGVATPHALQRGVASVGRLRRVRCNMPSRGLQRLYIYRYIGARAWRPTCRNERTRVSPLSAPETSLLRATTHPGRHADTTTHGRVHARVDGPPAARGRRAPIRPP
jgi:hypothetical protein